MKNFVSKFVLVFSRIMTLSMALATASVFSLPVNAGEYDNDEKRCSDHKKILEEKLSQGFSVEELVQRIKAKNPKIILLGEEHTGVFLRQRQAQFLSSLKEAMPDLNCLFVEMADRDESREQILFYTSKGNAGRDYGLIPEYNPIFATAKKLGIKIIPADSSWNWRPSRISVFEEKDRGVTGEGIEQRNRDMASIISSGFSNEHHCRRSVAQFGKFHLTSHVDGVGRSLPDFLGSEERERKSKRSFVLVNMVQAGDLRASAQALDFDWRWKACEEKPRVPLIDVAFSNVGSPKDFPITYRQEGRMTDFDFTWVMPVTRDNPY